MLIGDKGKRMAGVKRYGLGSVKSSKLPTPVAGINYSECYTPAHGHDVPNACC